MKYVFLYSLLVGSIFTSQALNTADARGQIARINKNGFDYHKDIGLLNYLMEGKNFVPVADACGKYELDTFITQLETAKQEYTLPLMLSAYGILSGILLLSTESACAPETRKCHPENKTIGVSMAGVSMVPAGAHLWQRYNLSRKESILKQFITIAFASE